MQDNAIIIKLQDTDITTAQEDPDLEGIIHIPSIEYDHCVQEVEVPGQSFFNGLYLNVKDLEIGGSGLPIIIDNVRLSNGPVVVNTWDFTLITQQTQFTLSNQALVVVLEYNDNYYGIQFYATYGVSKQVTIPHLSSIKRRYYLFNNTGNDPRLALRNGNNALITLKDQYLDDNESVFVVLNNFIDFDWGNN